MPAAPLPSAPPTARARFWTALLLGAVTLAAALNLACFGARVADVVTRGDLAMTTGDEEFSVYPVWKVAHHRPLYERPDRDNEALTPYNFGFYESYGVLLGRLGRLDDAALMTGARLLTAAFALVGAAGQYFLCLWLLGGGPARPGRAARWLLAALAVLVWPGTGFNSWNAISVRPDVPGAALALWGLLAYALSWRRERAPGTGPTRGLLVAAGILFYAAWAFKQSLVWTLAGVSLHAVWRAVAPDGEGRRRAEAVLWLCLPVGAALAATVVVGGDVYRFDTIRVQSFFVYQMRPGLSLLAKTIVPNGLLWLFAPVALWHAGGFGGRARALTQHRAFPLGLALLPALGFGVVALCKLGAGANTIIEAFVLASALSMAWVARAVDAVRGPTLPWAALAALGLLPVPATQLALAARQGDVASRMIGPLNVGGLSRLTPAEYRRRAALARAIATLPKPLFTRDAVFALPWHATDDRWPIFLVEPQVWDMFQRAGIVRGDITEERVRARSFATLVLSPRDRLYPVAIEAGYRAQELPADAAGAPDAYGTPPGRLVSLER